ncbi:hypothetical protein NST07_26005 [Paenibacillus sp. FSL L8-0340]|uniref:hypothetical protein n=1 Tax=Paenibacillus sp. FSL L8-0340 TaxID=2954685 RepID=UPI0031592568
MEFRKKPVLVDAVQYTPGLEDGYACYVIGGGRFVGYHDKRTPVPPAFRKVPAIKTLEGFHEISAGDWIVTGILGERYPCKPEVFAQTYESADGPPHEDEAHGLIREKYAYWRENRLYGWSAADGMEYTLNMLGIKIEGVNA